MYLGLKGRTAIVCAASKGLGRACAEVLAEESVTLFLNARDPARLEQAAAEISTTHKVQVTAVPGDTASQEGRAALLAACPSPDILVNNAGGPPPGKLKSWTPDDWSNAIDLRITRIRRKLEADPGKPAVIRTVRGIGYMFVPPDA